MDVKLIVAGGGTKKQAFRLRSQDTLIGRRQGCDVRIPSSSVSRRHCRLFVSEEILAVEDLASVNGTFVNGRRVHKTEFLRPGDQLRVGSILFVVHYELSEKARARLAELTEEGGVGPADIHDAEGAGSSAFQGLEEAIPVDDDNAPAALEVDVLEDEGTPSPRKKAAKQGKKAKSEPADDEETTVDASALLAKPWKAPAGEHLRDILTKLEDEG